MRWIVVAAILSGSSVVADEADICSGWELDRASLEAMIAATDGFRDALKDIPSTDPSWPLAKRLTDAMSMVLEGANGAFDVTGEIYGKTCPKPS
jgi:hypothetical protein